MVSTNGHSRKDSFFHFSPRRTFRGFRTIYRRFSQLGIVALLTVLGLTVGVVGVVGVQAASADPSGAVVLLVEASPSTTVGLQVFANVNISGGDSPTGTLTYSLFGIDDPTCSETPVFTSTMQITGTSVNSNRYWTTQAGTYRWEVSYSGDANNSPVNPTDCSDPSSAVVVSPAMPALTPNANAPSGGAITASAMIYGYNPTGTITFFLTPPGDTFCSGTPVFTSTVTVQGDGTYTSAPYVYPGGGLYKWQASYSGDANNTPAPITSCLNAPSEVTVPLFASFTYPVNGQAGVTSTTPFSWQTVPSATGYFLTVGTRPSGWDVAWSGVLPPSQSSYLVSGLPAGTLYATLYTAIGGVWVTLQEVTFTSTPSEAGFTSPMSAETNVSTTAPFTWTTVSGVQGYALWISDTYGGADLFGTGLLPATQSSITPPPLPAGKTLYAILFTLRNNVWSSQDITFSTAG